MRIDRQGGGVVGTQTTKSTTNANPTIIDTVPIPEDEALKISVNVTCKKDDLTEKGGFLKEAQFANNSGVLDQEGSTVSLFHRAKDGYDVVFVENGTDVDIKVIGAIGDNIAWKCLRTIISV